VPNLGVKVDAVPGRVSTCTLFTFVDGVFYGQCSELCGVLHGFMPICVESVPMDMFFNWALMQAEYFEFVKAMKILTKLGIFQKLHLFMV
jgi:heme/copper-type cytochrome/quinol oxidase subunit 2